jgi:hypothetical protein
MGVRYPPEVQAVGRNIEAGSKMTLKLYISRADLKELGELAPCGYPWFLVPVFHLRVVAFAFHANSLHNLFLAQAGFFSKLFDGFHFNNIVTEGS